MIQFSCPSCKSICTVDDKFAGRKIKCPKCGARVVHIRDSHVELLTAGTAPTAPPAAVPPAAAPPSIPPLGEATPVATAVVPHLVGEFVQQSESKQNVLIIGGMIGVVTASVSIVGIVIDKPIVVVTPIGIALVIAAVWLWLRKKKLEQKLTSAKSAPKPKG